jgi:hypothetical protein
VCFCLEASDTFTWDTDTEPGNRVADAVFWLGTSEINFPLTSEVLAKIKQYVLTGENLLEIGKLSRPGAKLHQSKLRESGA